MGIYTLFVEGKTETQIINAIKASTSHPLLIQDKGSKDRLETEVKLERVLKSRKDIYFLRDRDFDFDVPTGIDCPQSITRSGELLGWHWCRHEIENYFLEPALICKAIPRLEKQDYLNALASVAIKIRHYVAARWTIGYAKRKTHIPPYFSLRTKPESLSDFSLPEDLSQEAVKLWMHEEAHGFRNKVDSYLSEQVLTERYRMYEDLFSDEKCSNISWILHTFPGKNLFAGLSQWLTTYHLDPGSLKGSIVSFITRNPEEAVTLIPEWQQLIYLWTNPEINTGKASD